MFYMPNCGCKTSLFGNNSGKPESLWTKFYMQTSVQVARFPANFGALS